MKKSIVVALTVLLMGMMFPFSRAYAGTATSISGSSDGTNYIFDVAVSGVDYWYDQTSIQVTYAEGFPATLLMIAKLGEDSAEVRYGWDVISGSSMDITSSTSDSYTARISIPKSVFGGKAFTLTSGSATITSAQLEGSSSGSSSGTGSDSGTSDSSGSGTSDSTTPTNPVDISTLEPTANGKITVDGSNSDWTSVDALSSDTAKVAEWKLARDTNGNVYLMFDGIAETEWDYNYQWYTIEMTQNGQTAAIQVANLESQAGATLVIQNNANHNTAASYVVEAMIPASYFTDANATIKFVGDTVKVEDIPVLDGVDTTEEAPTVYQGIVIDGSYLDWAPVTKYPSNDINGEIDQVAMVWDGDMVYLYISETPGTLGAYHAGTHGNGKYEIITDLGNRMVFELNYDGTVSGPAGATAQHVGNQWEIAIPASNLPDYLDSISFGMYQSDSMISDVTNLNGQGSGGTFNGIVYDGLYGDWESYPHHIIEYATAGTQENVEDARGALYADADTGTLYGHVVTTMRAHVDNDNGHEFTSGVTIQFNDDWATSFYPMVTTVDSNGNITWSPQKEGLDNGTYEFYIMSTDAWHSSSNISNLNDMDTCFGKMTVTVGDSADECEFYLDLDKIAAKFGVDPNDFRKIAAQFINIGDEWIITAGTSTAPFVGVGLGIGAVACVLGLRKWRDGRDGRNGRGGSDGTWKLGKLGKARREGIGSEGLLGFSSSEAFDDGSLGGSLGGSLREPSPTLSTPITRA